MIAWVIWATTHLGGDSEPWVRLAAPLLLVEVVVTLVEAAGYRWVTGLSARRALLVSLLCNATTTAIGVVLMRSVPS